MTLISFVEVLECGSVKVFDGKGKVMGVVAKEVKHGELVYHEQESLGKSSGTEQKKHVYGGKS